VATLLVIITSNFATVDKISTLGASIGYSTSKPEH